MRCHRSTSPLDQPATSHLLPNPSRRAAERRGQSRKPAGGSLVNSASIPSAADPRRVYHMWGYPFDRSQKLDDLEPQTRESPPRLLGRCLVRAKRERRYPRRGSCTLKVVPVPSADSTSIQPPWACTIRSAM